MVTCCYFHSSSFILTLTSHTHFLSNKYIICLCVQCKTHLLAMAVVGVRCYFKGFHRLIWQLCRVHNRQLDPKMMQSQTHTTSTVSSLSFSFIPLIDVFSIFISHFYPFCFCVRFLLFSLRYWNQCLPKLSISVNVRTCAHLCWFSSCGLHCRWTHCTCRTQMHFQCSAVESWREALYRAQSIDMFTCCPLFRQKSVFLYCCPVTQDAFLISRTCRYFLSIFPSLTCVLIGVNGMKSVVWLPLKRKNIFTH